MGLGVEGIVFVSANALIVSFNKTEKNVIESLANSGFNRRRQNLKKVGFRVSEFSEFVRSGWSKFLPHMFMENYLNFPGDLELDQSSRRLGVEITTERFKDSVDDERLFGSVHENDSRMKAKRSIDLVWIFFGVVVFSSIFTSRAVEVNRIHSIQTKRPGVLQNDTPVF